MSETDAARQDARKRTTKPKTAVVVIHGMGEQRPMDTIRGVVDALWSCDRDLVPADNAETYSMPDTMSGSFDLRRITTRHAELEDGLSKRADFFEFYWAHLMTGNTVGSVATWLWGLLWRPPWTVPGRLLWPWLAGLAAYAIVLVLLALAAYQPFLKQVLAWLGLGGDLPQWPFGVAAVFAGVATWFGGKWLAPVAGDAARYLSPIPDNIAARQKIRETGVELLTKLHESGRYDRIVVVGHSLGSVVGFDVLYNAWARLRADDLFARHRAGSAPARTMAALEAAAGALIHARGDGAGAARIAYRQAQRAYAQALAAAGDKPLWLVSDFVTLGCPLSKADVLLAFDAADLRARKARREIPTSPPWLEENDVEKGRFRFSYPIDAPTRAPHHAAVFAPVVWTNAYFPSLLIAFGDIISGAVAPILGRGVLDVRLKIGAPVFRHLDYWKAPKSDPPKPWLRALRRAVNLRRLDEAALWGGQAARAEVLGDELPAHVAPPSR